MLLKNSYHPSAFHPLNSQFPNLNPRPTCVSSDIMQFMQRYAVTQGANCTWQLRLSTQRADDEIMECGEHWARRSRPFLLRPSSSILKPWGFSTRCEAILWKDRWEQRNVLQSDTDWDRHARLFRSKVSSHLSCRSESRLYSDWGRIELLNLYALWKINGSFSMSGIGRTISSTDDGFLLSAFPRPGAHRLRMEESLLLFRRWIFEPLLATGPPAFASVFSSLLTRTIK